MYWYEMDMAGGGGATQGCTVGFGCIFISWAMDGAALASAFRLLRLRRHTKATIPMIASTTMGTTAAAAYIGVLFACFRDQSHP
jgi:hypothetical protein